MKALKKILPESFKERYRWRWWALRHRLGPPALPRNADGRVEVHLGCGQAKHPRFINIDAMPWPHVHHVCGVDRLPMLADGSVDLIYVSHCLEHLSFLDVPAILKEWRRTLKRGGLLRISVPDFDLILAIYRSNEQRIESMEPTLMGGQDYAYNFHKSIYNQDRLGALLEAAGFGRAQLWTPGADDLTPFSDWSGKTVAVGDRRYPVSLNMEARNDA